MRKILLLIVLSVLSISLSASEKKMNAAFSYALFKDPDSFSYIETYLSVSGRSVYFSADENGQFRAAVDITMIFKQNDSVVAFGRYELLSPLVEDTTAVNFNFLDQQRFFLANGTYDFELYIADVNSGQDPFFVTDKIEINIPSEVTVFSDIQLVASFSPTQNQNILSKSGLDLVPFIYNFYPKTLDKIIFYTEIYNTLSGLGPNAPFLITYYLKSWETQIPLTRYTRFKRESAKNIVALLGELSIKDLPSGNYNLVVEVRDSANNLVTDKEIFLYRSNPELQYKIDSLSASELMLTFVNRISSVDSLRDYIKSLYPISNVMERNFADNIVRQNDVQLMQNYFYTFWQTRDRLNPETAWNAYNAEVQKVNAVYGTRIKKGYDTDRGRVYLQYGAPNSIAKSEFEPSAYPYEIWHYYRLQTQSNRRFVFYSREFATNDYELIHSDAIGEVNDPRWQVKIHKRDTPTHSLDPEGAEQHWGGRINDYYRNPR